MYEELAVSQINIFQCDLNYLAPSQPRREQQHDQAALPRKFRRRDQLPNLLLGEGDGHVLFQLRQR